MGNVNRLQALMDQSYKRWHENDDAVKKALDAREISQDEANERRWNKHNFTVQCSFEEKLAVMIGNFNYQVCNGGFCQYHDNGYSVFADDLVRSLKKVQNAKVFKVIPKVIVLIEAVIPFFGELDNASQNADCYCAADDDENCHCDDTSDYNYISQQLDDLSNKYYDLNKLFLVEAEMLFDDDLNYVGDQLEMQEKVEVEKSDLPTLKPKAELIGQDGNVFSVIGLTRKALRRAGLANEAKEFQEKALKAESYDQVLQLCMEYVEVY